MTPDELFMQRAMELAQLGIGAVSPNPRVGCVIVHDGKIIGEGWHQKFGMAADPKVNGIGDSLEQVAAFKPTVANLQGYAEAVREKTLACLNSLTPADLDRDLAPPAGGDSRKVGAWLAVILLDHLHHSGQVCYIRGYLTGKGWFPR